MLRRLTRRPGAARRAGRGVGFDTWQTLRRSGLGDEEAVAPAADLVAAAKA